MSDIFLSHASDDKPRIRLVAQALEREGLQVWWDMELQAGEVFGPEIEAKLKAARCVVVFWSRASVSPKRLWVRSEAAIGMGRGVLLPVLLEDVSIPVPFDQIHTTKLLDWDGDTAHPAYQALVSAIRAALVRSERAAREPAPEAAARSQKRALLVGVASYLPESQLAQLPAARRNVEALERALAGPECNFAVTTLRDPNRQELERALELLFIASGRDDLVLFYYSGHAILTGPGTLHLGARDSEPKLVNSTTVSLSWLGKTIIDRTPAAQVMLVLDACYGAAAASEITGALQTYLGQGHSKLLISSAASRHAGPEAWQEDHSLFTSRLLRSITTEAADSNKDGVVTAEEIVQYVAEELERVDPELRPRDWSFDAAPVQMEIARRAAGEGAALSLHPAQKAFVANLAPELSRGKIIPFLGDGVYGSGPLSCFRVAGALAAHAGLSADERYTIATAAESLEQQREDRSVFLEEMREILDEQSARAERSSAHEVILDMKPPWLVISATYDTILEQRLEEAGKPYVLVCHVLRSKDGSDNGKLLVVRSKNHPDVQRDPSRAMSVCLASELLLDEARECVVYKLLGSPLLHDLPIARERGLDTVVVTETDHITFLTRLENQDTTVPMAFSVPFQIRRLLFLGYNLDIWHYRLIGHIFSRSGFVRPKKRPFAVRTPTSPLEERFWKQFGAEMVSIDLPALVSALRAARSSVR
jgi:hypothetical protein